MPSSSRSISRRRILAATGSGLGAALAGCTGDDRSSSSADDSHATHEVSEGGAPTDSTHEYESLLVRANGADRFVYQDEDEAPDDERADSDASEDDYPPTFRRSIVFVTDADEADALWTDADTEIETELRSFVADTDFATQTIAIDQRQIEDCYERHLLSVQAEDDQFRTDYCRQLKAPETPCEADRTLMEAIAIRVDRTYEETPSGRGSSESMSCRGAIVHGEDGLEDDSVADVDPSGNESTTNESGDSAATEASDR